MAIAIDPHVVDELMRRVEAQYKADLAALIRLKQLLESPMAVSTLDIRSFTGATHREILLDVMRSAPNRSWSPAELSRLTGLSQGSIRTVVYSNQDDFEKDDSVSSPGRARWRLRSAVNV